MLRVLTSGPGFACLLVLLLLLALWQPAVGAKGGWLHPPLLSELLVVVIFLIQGSRLDLKNFGLLLKQPVGSFALQAGIVFLPLLWVKIFWTLGMIPEFIFAPLFFAAILPTTISSCVVFTSNAQGNADYTLGHATLSNLLALLLVPVLWAGSCNIGGIFDLLLSKILGIVIIPCFFGWLFARVFSKFNSVKIKEWYRQIPMLCIGWLVYLTLCESIRIIGREQLLPDLKLLFPYCMGFVLLLHLSGWIFSIRWTKKRDLQISQFFCLSQKSMVTGLPIATVLFAETEHDLIRIILSLFCIHFQQLLLGSLLLKSLRGWVEADEMAK